MWLVEKVGICADGASPCIVRFEDDGLSRVDLEDGWRSSIVSVHDLVAIQLSACDVHRSPKVIKAAYDAVGLRGCQVDH